MENLANILDDWPLWGLSKTPIAPHQIKPLSGGLTNICYHLILDSGDYILRISAPNTDALGINREREKHIHQCVSHHHFTSPLRYSADDHSYWIRDYISGEVLGDSVANTSDLSDSLLAYLIEKLKLLHQTAITFPLPPINISDVAESYWQLLEANNPNDDVLKMKSLMQVSMQEPPAGDFCLCHMDPVLANWLYTSQGVQLLDWEYSGMAHPLWDLAAFLQGIKEQLNLDLNKTEQKNELDEIEEKIVTLYGVTDFTAWRRAKVQMEYLSSLWYRAQG